MTLTEIIGVLSVFGTFMLGSFLILYIMIYNVNEDKKQEIERCEKEERTRKKRRKRRSPPPPSDYDI
ncbi:MAG: hypothetical protein IJ934_02795 [Acetobacter sp.]|nr:hypothetical protein [Acetobacter sp.]